MKDATSTIADLKEIVGAFCDRRGWGMFHNPKDLAIGIITESSELLEIFRFKSEKEVEEWFESKSRKEEIGGEMADILFFLLRFAERFDVDLSEQLARKIEKNEKRYPADRNRDSIFKSEE